MWTCADLNGRPTKQRAGDRTGTTLAAELITKSLAAAGLLGVILYGYGFAYVQSYYGYFGVSLDEAGVSRLAIVSIGALLLAALLLLVLIPVAMVSALVAMGSEIKRIPKYDWILGAGFAFGILLWIIAAHRSVLLATTGIVLFAIALIAGSAAFVASLWQSVSQWVTTVLANMHMRRIMKALRLFAVVVIGIAAIWGVLQLNDSGWRDALTASSAICGSRSSLVRFLIPDAAPRMTINWNSASPPEIGKSDVFLYVGNAGGVTVLYDYSALETVRIPSAQVDLRTLPSTTACP